MNSEFFIPQSPNNDYSNEGLSEEELYQNIFSLKLEVKENINGNDLDNLYYLNINSKKSQNQINQKEPTQKEDDPNAILLIDDYDLIFNKLETNKKEEEDKNEVKVQNINENYKMEDNNLPCFANNFISENKYFHFIESEKEELFIKIDDPIKIEKTEKQKDFETEPIQIKKPKKTQKRKKSPNSTLNNPKSKSDSKPKPKKKRGPYKKDVKIIEQVNTEDKYFPFNTGKGIFNSQNPIMQTNPYICTIDFSEMNESENSEMNKDNYNYLESESSNKNYEDEKKVEDNKSQNEQIACLNNLCLKFSTKKYFIAANGKKKKVKKKRKYKPDDIRKKIKARFHKAIKNIINENLKKAGSTEMFDFFPQCFIGNVSKKLNSKSFDLTYKELLLTDFHKEVKSNYLNSKADIDKYTKNKKVLKYLEENPEISKRAGFDIVQNIKYKELLSMYFNSAQFENSLYTLKDEKEPPEYIQEYIHRARTYVSFYSNYDEKEEKKINNMNLNEE